MALSCASKVVKYILFVLNFLFWLTGVCLLGIGIWILAAHSVAVQYLHIANIDYGLVQGAAITVVIVGSIVFIIGVLGCCGALKENQPCLSVFSGILIFLLVLQFIAVILAGSLHSQIIHTLATEMNSTMVQRYAQYHHRLETEAWDLMQIQLECCGVSKNGPEDWTYTSWYIYNSTNPVPDSCCVLENKRNITYPTPKNATACYEAATKKYLPDRDRKEYVHTKGCEEKINNWFMDYLGAFIGVVVAIIISQIIIVILTCVLKSSIQNSYEHI